MSSDTPLEDFIPAPEEFNFKQIGTEITRTLNKAISDLLCKVLINTDNQLLELAKVSEQAESHDRYFNGLHQLREQRTKIGQAFAKSLSTHLKPGMSADNVIPFQSMTSNISEKRKQAIEVLNDRSLHQHETSLIKLVGQLQRLYDVSSSSIHPDALIPHNFCQAYLDSISDMRLDHEIDDILFQHFDDDFISQLDSLYQDLSTLLDRHNITGRLVKQSAEPAIDNSTEAPDDEEKIKQVINEFIHGDEEDNQRTSRATPASKQFYGRDDVIQALTNLQLTFKPHYTVGEKTKVTTDDFKMSLLNSMAKLRPGTSMRSVAAIDAKTIEFVEMVFDAFMDDPNISSAIKNLLLRLQIPIIKLAMLDSKLFENRKHPGRNVLDKIAHIGIGIEDTENTLFQTLDLIVQQVLQGYDKNISSIQTALNSLNRLEVNETESQTEKEKLTQKKIIQEHARQIVLLELQYHVKENYIPKQIQPLILKYWATLMMYRYLQHGNESTEWNEAVTLLKLLISSLQPIKDQNEWFCLNNSYQEICQRFEELLLETKQEQTKLSEAIATLVQIFTGMLEQSKFKPDEPEFDESAFDTITLDKLTDQISADDSITPMQEEADSNRQKIALLPGYVKPGGWYEIHASEESPKRRLKLSVIIMEDARLVFVDRLGVKVLDKDAEEFAEELKQGQSAFLADDSIFDNALTRVIGSLSPK